MIFEATDIKFLKGIGEKRAKILQAELGVHTFGDLLDLFPYRYSDRSKFYSIAEFHSEMPALQVKGRFIRFNKEGAGARQRLVGIFSDGERIMEAVWFAGIKNIEKMYFPGQEYILFGKPQQFRNVWSMVHPEVEKFDPNRIPKGLQGVYSIPESARRKGLTQRMLQDAVRNLLANPRISELKETLPRYIVNRYKFPNRIEAYKALHFPEKTESLKSARERMKFEELYFLELQILRYATQRNHSFRGYEISEIGKAFNTFYSTCLPFSLTEAQKRVLREIRNDMRRGHQMNRLLQGDVGSGKTMVAFMSALMVIDNGLQATIMAPTEILATQHFETISKWGNKIGVEVELLTGSTPSSKRKKIHENLQNGKINILIGTHALLEEKVGFHRLGLAVIDEQHRFGVAQRARIWSKGNKELTPPHVLVMTATPIPRTLAMTLYGDLEVSVIDELPPGRKPVSTFLRSESSRLEIYRHIWRQLREGRQAYIVHPLIHDNPKMSLQSLETGLQRIYENFPGVEVGFVHGQMKPQEKDYQMQKFQEGRSKILVATTVIEVGVNVPNASVMVIENAERFGLSQLHQLRGRVGRGADQSWCIMIAPDKISRQTRRRLEIMTETNDGFLLSEADLKMRGPGDMEGTQQSGLPLNLKIANLASDGQIVAQARREASFTLEVAPMLAVPSVSITPTHPEDQSTIIKKRTQESNPGILTPEEEEMLIQQLNKRFARKIDWSAIS